MTNKEKLTKVLKLTKELQTPAKIERSDLIDLIGSYAGLCKIVDAETKNIKGDLFDKQIASSAIFGFLKQEKLEEVKNKKLELDSIRTKEMLKLLDLGLNANKGQMTASMKELQRKAALEKPS